MLRTDGGGQEADPAPHKTEQNGEEGKLAPAAVTNGQRTDRERESGEAPPKPAATKSSDAGFGSFG